MANPLVDFGAGCTKYSAVTLFEWEESTLGIFYILALSKVKYSPD
jgi:hypothetical protein